MRALQVGMLTPASKESCPRPAPLLHPFPTRTLGETRAESLMEGRRSREWLETVICGLIKDINVANNILLGT